MKTVVIGVGNPVLTDDGVGIHVAKRLRTVIPAGNDVTVRTAYAGGLRLMDAMIGFDRAIIVDALWTGVNPPGTVVRLEADELKRARNTASVHDLDLSTALDFAAHAGVKVPSRIEAWGVEIDDATTFSEDLTPAVRAAMPHVVGEICRSIQRGTTLAPEEVH
jgi:hydrogenase maturation protease